ncbi:MAG: FAD-linked oxidase C-terminal domain-containing protein [Paracoccaceae bacterium]
MAISDAISELSLLLGKHLVRSKSDLAIHGHSESHFPVTPPDAVAYPKNTRQLAQIVSICAKHNCPVIGWGAGTSLEGHTLAVQGGVTVDFSRMNKVLQVNAADMNVVVQSGLTREDLNTHLRDTGLFFPVDPGANASLGGMVATGASGTTTVRYGTMGDNVMALELVLASGQIIRTGSQAAKSSAGYDLTALMVGSEGTLGLISEITLRLHGQPEAISAAVCAFPTIDQAVNAVIATIQLGIPMARIEFIDAATVTACNAYSKTDLPQQPHLMVEFHGSVDAVAEQAAQFGEVAADYDAADFQWSAQPEDRAKLWAMRHNAYYACLALRPGARALVTDICLPISKLAQAVRETQDDIAASSIDGPILGHVGDGNFHAILLVDPNIRAEMDAAHELSAKMSARALKLGGTITGEHGIGMGKLGFMDAQHGAAWPVMAEIKRALDPKNIMNPGKVVRLN